MKRMQVRKNRLTNRFHAMTMMTISDAKLAALPPTEKWRSTGHHFRVHTHARAAAVIFFVSIDFVE
jgi:hypothetical protein